MEKFIVLITGERGNATLRGSPLRLYHYDDIEVEAAIAWQVSGGFARSGMCVAIVDQDRPGVMLSEDGKAVLIYNEGWTDEAFAKFIVRNWS